MLIHSIRHDWPEKAGFVISRPKGHPQYTFLHFSTPVRICVGGEVLDARPGACIFYSPNAPQWFSSQSDMVHNWMHAGSALMPLLSVYEIPENELLYPNNTDFISEIFQKIELEHFSNHPHREQLIDSYFTEFLIHFSRSIHTDSAQPILLRNEQIKFRNIRHQVLSQVDRKWTVTEIARLAALSPSRFHAVYKSLFGTSPIQDVIEAKIRYAKSLLLSDGSLTLPEIAEKLGYHNQYHFIRQFKAYTGKTPGAFRKEKR